MSEDQSSHEAFQTTRGFNIIFIHSSLDDAGLTPHQFRVFAHLSRRAGSGEAFACNASMAEKCKIHPDTLRECLNELQRRRMVTRQDRPGKTTIWRLTAPSNWDLNPVSHFGVQTPPLVSYPPESKVGHPPESKVGHPPEKNPPEGNPSKGITKEIQRGASKGRFKKPELSEVKLRAVKIGLPDNEAEKFYDYYESNGWKVGKNPMRSWTSALANWHRHWVEYTGGVVKGQTAPKQQTVFELKTIVQAKQQSMADLRNKFCLEVAMGDQWKDVKAKAKYFQLKREIKELNQQISNAAHV